MAAPGQQDVRVVRHIRMAASRPSHLLRLVHPPVDPGSWPTFSHRRSDAQDCTVSFGIIDEPSALAGLIGSIIRLLGLDLAVPDLSWVRLHDEYRTEGFPPAKCQFRDGDLRDLPIEQVIKV